MKRLLFVTLLCAILIVVLLSGCAPRADVAIAATTLPVYQFTTALCQGTDLTVGRVVSEPVSCLHDYSLSIDQMRLIEGAELVVKSGAGLEDFFEDALSHCDTIVDASQGLALLPGEDGRDPHIWLSPSNAMAMARTICQGLSQVYPQNQAIFEENLGKLTTDLQTLQQYGRETLSSLSCRELITFHDGFAYFADSFDLTILAAVEEESGSEASAADLASLIELVEGHRLPAVFTEINGSDAAAKVIAQATGSKIYSLDMAMAGDDYFSAMYHNIDTVKEALG